MDVARHAPRRSAGRPPVRAVHHRIRDHDLHRPQQPDCGVRGAVGSGVFPRTGRRLAPGRWSRRYRRAVRPMTTPVTTSVTTPVTTPVITDGNKNILRSFVHDVLDGQNLDAMTNYLSGNFLHHDQAPGELTGEQTGVAGQKNFFSRVVFAAFSGFATVFEDLVGENDLVAGRWRQSSRNTGPWVGRAPTGATTEI